MSLPFRIASSRPVDVVGVGQNSADLVAVVEPFPEPDTKQELCRIETLPGGQVATAVAAAARLGCRAEYIGRFGGDALGAVARDGLRRAGVELSRAIAVADAPNRTAIILVDAGTGRRTVLASRDSRLRLSPADLAPAAIASARILLVDAEDVEASIHAARLAKGAGTLVIVDVDTPRTGVDELLKHADAIVTAAGFPEALTDEPHLERALARMEREFAAGFVCTTLGAAGCVTRVRGRDLRTPAFPVNVVDTTGAGDVFRGAMAAAFLRWPDGPLDRVLRFASAAAALNCTAAGAQGGLPSLDEVDDLTLRGSAGLNRV